MQMLSYFGKTERWHKLDKLSTKYIRAIDVTELKKFQIIKESLTLNEEQNIILKSHMIFVITKNVE